MTKRIAYRTPEGRAVDLTIINEASHAELEPLNPKTAEPIPHRRVIRRACDMFGITVDELHSESRTREKFLAQYALGKTFYDLGLGYSRIAQILKRDDHTTATNWVRQSTLYEEFPPYQAILAELRLTWAFRVELLSIAA